MKKIALVAVLSTLFALPMLSHAESDFQTATSGSLTATARLDFRVTIPKVLFLRVGTGGAGTLGTSGTIDLIDFAVPAANLGNGTAVAATAASGDLTNGAVTVRVFANGGTNNVTLNSTTTGLMKNSAGDTINWADITVTAAALPTATAGYTNAGITHPTFNNTAGGGAGTATTLTPPASKVVRLEGKWTFAYANTAAIPAGTYGGTTALNGRVTYTAVQP